METVLIVVHVMLALTLVILVLLQRSEGGALGMGGGGGGGMGGLVSSRSAANFLTRATAILAACFMVTSLVLTIMARDNSPSRSILDAAETAPLAAEEVPADDGLPSVPVSD